MDITTPTFMVDRKRAESNIRKMVDKARRSDSILRPHFKTHQSKEIGRWFRDAGVDRITVSSVTMAEYFASDGWNDITIAFPVNILEAKKIDTLAASINLGLLADSRDSVRALDRMLEHDAGIWIKTDTGYNRSGVLWTDATKLRDLVRDIETSKHLSFRGLLTHSGHAYHVRGAEQHARLFTETENRLQEARASFSPSQQEHCRLSLGDTPTCIAADTLKEIDEIRPGNFVFFDVQQLMLGSCREDEISAAAVCPVVGVYPDRKEAVIYGGAVHLSKQAEVLSEGTKIYGFVVPWTGKKWGAIDPGCYIRDVSQEHGIVRYTGKVPVKPGDLVAVLPVHSCLTMNLMKGSVTVMGEA